MPELSITIRFALSGAAVIAALALGGSIGLGAALLSAALTFVAMPLFRRYAMARPNARSSHTVPMPQGGGGAVVVATLLAMAFAMQGFGMVGLDRLGWIGVGALLLAAVGAVDDIRSLAVLPRLGLQLLGVGLVVIAGSGAGSVLPWLPWPLEVLLLVLAGTWFVNLTNFMDGIDGITLAGFLPLAGAAIVLSALGHTSPGGGLLAVCFFGALAGFVVFNLPRARLFLGDVGSLPIGLLGGALLLDLAQHGAFAAAVILPLYHFTDATVTLVRRLLRREKVWEAHRQHAYQNAVDGGWSHARVSAMVLVLNLGLAALAQLSTRVGPAGQVACIGAGSLAVVGLILIFRRRARQS